MNNTTPVLEGGALLLNQLELVTPTTVTGTLYGITFVLFCLDVHALVPRLKDGDRKRQAQFMLMYSTVIMLCGLYSLVANAWVAQDAYIKHGSYPGGPYAYVLATIRTPTIIVGLSCQTVIRLLTSAIQIWRVWVVWTSATRHATLIIVLPSLCFLAFTALRLRSLVLEIIVPIAKAVQLDANTQTAEIALQAATTMLCTALISVFLLVEQRRQSKLIGKAGGSGGYMKIVTILVESYALESVCLLLIASLANVGPVVAFFSEAEINIEILAYLLVQYRVASGKAYESKRVQSRMTSLHWNHSESSNHATTQFEATSEAGRDHHVLKPGASDALIVSSMA